MIFGRIKNISIVVVLNMLASYPVLASDRLTGLDIKEQAVSYFMQQGLNINLLVSDKRTFFPCEPSVTAP